MAAAAPRRAAALGLALGFVAGACVPASAAAPEGLVTILFLKTDRGDEARPAELEAALEDAGLQRPSLVAECAARVAASCLNGSPPRLVVALRPLPEPAAAALRARSLPFLLVPASAKDAARMIVERAAAAVSTGAASAAQRADAERRLASAHFASGEDASAKASLERALALVPDDDESLRLLFDAELRGVFLREALRWADRAAALPGLADGRRADVLVGRAQARELLGDAGGAEDDLTSALKLRPGDAEASFRLAQLTRDRPSQALPYADRAAGGAATVAARAAAHRLGSAIRLDLGDEPGARRSLETAPGPAGDELERLQAFVLLERDSPGKAAVYAERAALAAGSAPLWERPAAFRFCSRLWLELKDYPKALESLKSALALSPDDLYALEAMAQIKRDAPQATLDFSAPAVSPARPEERMPSEAELRRALDSNPQDLEALGRLIELERGRGRLPEARRLAGRFMDAAREASPWRRPAAYRHITEVWDELGEDSWAERSLGLARDLDRRSLEFEELALRVRPADSRAAVYLANRVTANVAVAEARAELGDEDGAAKALERALALSPDAASALERMARLKLDQGRPREALAYSDRLVAAAAKALPAERAAALRQRARIQLALKDDDAAKKSLEGALALSEDRRPDLTALTELALAEGATREALVDAGRLIDASAEAPPAERADAERRRARIQFALGDGAGERKSLERALALAPDNPQALRMLAELELGQARPSEALALAGRLVDAAAKAPPAEKADAEYFRARIRLSLHDDAGALKSLKIALEASPSPRPELAMLTQLELAQGATREALRYAERLVDASASAPPAERAAAERQKAGIQLELRDDGGAAASLTRALAITPDDRESLVMLIRLERARGRPREALAYAERLVDASNGAAPAERGEAYRQRGLIRLELHDDGEAREDLVLALEDSGDDMESLWALVIGDRKSPKAAVALVDSHRPRDSRLEAAWRVARGMAKAMAGDAAAARSDFEEAVKIDSTTVCFGEFFSRRRDQLDPLFFDACAARFPGTASLYLDRGVALYRSGRVEAATSDFIKAVELKPDFLEARLSLATALAAQGRRDAAAAEAETALALSKDRESPIYAQLLSLRDSLRRSARPKP